MIQAAAPLPYPALTGTDPNPPGQAWEQTPVGDPQAEVGIKAQLNSMGEVTKEEDQTSFHELS